MGSETINAPKGKRTQELQEKPSLIDRLMRMVIGRDRDTDPTEPISLDGKQYRIKRAVTQHSRNAG